MFIIEHLWELSNVFSLHDDRKGYIVCHIEIFHNNDTQKYSNQKMQQNKQKPFSEPEACRHHMCLPVTEGETEALKTKRRPTPHHAECFKPSTEE